MNSLSMRPLVLVVALASAAAFGGWAAWSVNGWRLGEQITALERDQALTAEAASETARFKERAWSKQLEEARNAATKREATLRADAAAARGAVDGLRGDLAELRRTLPDLAADACRQRADALADVFGQCAARYSELAEKADRLVSDRQSLMDGWPQ